MSFSKESRYRNIFSTGDFAGERRGAPPILLIGCAAILLIVCCSCAGLITGLQFGGGLGNLTKSASLPFGQPGATPTLDKNAPVPLKKAGLMDNGLELTVINVQRPLKVEGGVKLPADQQFILITVQIANTKKTGAALKATAAEFKVKGDGGLTYDANPKTVTIPGLLNEVSVLPGKKAEVELIYQIATDDSGLRLLWKVGTQTRTFILEK
ncbi:MAG: DUF4352 domain-containing protein [Anaerolineales bacterium]|nr:DUF4352 domain-containing protein [Anaerolineales bacterium]